MYVVLWSNTYLHHERKYIIFVAYSLMFPDIFIFTKQEMAFYDKTQILAMNRENWLMFHIKYVGEHVEFTGKPLRPMVPCGSLARIAVQMVGWGEGKTREIWSIRSQVYKFTPIYARYNVCTGLLMGYVCCFLRLFRREACLCPGIEIMVSKCNSNSITTAENIKILAVSCGEEIWNGIMTQD